MDLSLTTTPDSPLPPRSLTSSFDGSLLNRKDIGGGGGSTTRRLISKHEMKEFRDAFRLFDKDGDGSITKEELGSVMRSLGQFARVNEIQEMLTEIDVDGIYYNSLQIYKTVVEWLHKI